MCTFIASTGFYLKKKGVSSLPKLPGPIRGYPRGIVKRLASEGIIAPQNDSTKNRTWAPGKNWQAMTKWWDKHAV